MLMKGIGNNWQYVQLLILDSWNSIHEQNNEVWNWLHLYCITFVALISLLCNFSNLDNCYERQSCWNPYFVVVQFFGFILVAIHVLDCLVGQKNPPPRMT
jgi:hypothetical protein